VTSKYSGDQLWTRHRAASLTGTPAMSPVKPLPFWLRDSGRHAHEIGLRECRLTPQHHEQGE